jgi:hypothetical protein
MRNDSDMDVGLVAAEFASGQLAPDRMPQAAIDLLVAGFDSPALRLAAGLDGADPREQRATFGKALEELGELPLTREEVGRRLFRLWAERIDAGEVEPLDGARALWHLETRCDVQLPDRLGEYGALDSDDLSDPEVERAYRREVREAARRWLDSNSA